MTERRTVRLLLACVLDQECSVIFEPFGAEYTLRADDEFRIEISGPGTGEVMIWYGPGAISVTPWVGGEYVSVVAADGRVLEV